MALCVVFFLAVALAAAGGGEAALVEHTFVVSQIKMHHLCKDTLVTVVNGQLPGPAIEVTEGDSVAVNVINKSPHAVTIHWHGVKQQLDCWADGAGMITQCPIQPNTNLTYRFDVIAQEGTLWWHAHVGYLRGTVHGALVIRPRSGPGSYPFPKPYKEIPIVIGEWWDIDLVQLEKNAARSKLGEQARSSTINGKLGDLNNCSDIIVISPGETVDALVTADAPTGRYYMVSMAIPSQWKPADPRTKMENQSRGMLHYNNSSSKIIPAVSPEMPGYDKGATSFYFHGNLTSLPHPFPRSVPASVDERLVMVTDMGYICKEGGSACDSVVARMNNISFQLPTETSLLQAHYNNNMSSTINLLREFPRSPPKIVFNQGTTMKATSLRRVRYNTTLEIVFQGPPEVFSFPNPMHLHGHDFFILAQGLGKYDAEKHVQTYNLVDPPMRNMALIPRFGWIAIRFVANNPGVWLLHCHIEQHVSTGMAMALVVDDGPTLDTALPPPPANYPICDGQSNKVAYE